MSLLTKNTLAKIIISEVRKNTNKNFSTVYSKGDWYTYNNEISVKSVDNNNKQNTYNFYIQNIPGKGDLYLFAYKENDNSLTGKYFKLNRTNNIPAVIKLSENYNNIGNAILEHMGEISLTSDIINDEMKLENIKAKYYYKRDKLIKDNGENRLNDFFLLDLDEFVQFYNDSSDKGCHYCGIKKVDIENGIAGNKFDTKRTTRRVFDEIDRIYHNRPYHIDNIVLACSWCNNAKTDEFAYKEFRKISKQISEIWEERLGIEMIQPDPISKEQLKRAEDLKVINIEEKINGKT